jgi:hypothetical protein
MRLRMRQFESAQDHKRTVTELHGADVESEHLEGGFLPPNSFVSHLMSATGTEQELGAGLAAPGSTSHASRNPRSSTQRVDASGLKRQEQRSEAIRSGRNPDEPVSRPPDALEDALKEASRNPPPRAPVPTIPGDRSQTDDTFSWVDPLVLWRLPRIQNAMDALAADTEARERGLVKPGGNVHHTAENMTAYWRVRFYESVEYILYRRGGGGIRAKLLRELRAKERKLVQKRPPPADLVAQVEALRQTFKDKWQEVVDIAADRYVTLASNEAQDLTVKQAAAWIPVWGLPESVEGAPVEASAHKDTLESDSTPVAPSVVVFMKAVQKESGLKAMAFNYPGHQRPMPLFGKGEKPGEYAFDVSVPISQDATGFYDREALVKFLVAVERAAVATKVDWIALYNDVEVAIRVNKTVTKRRIQFSGGGGEGSFHHGPSPYILHLHFSIMPIELANQYRGQKAVQDLLHWLLP